MFDGFNLLFLFERFSARAEPAKFSRFDNPHMNNIIYSTKLMAHFKHFFEIVHLLYGRQPYRKRRTARPVLKEPKPSRFYIRYYGLVVNTKTRIFVSTANATHSVTVTHTESTSAIQESFFVLLEFQMAPPRRASPKNLEGDRDYCGQLHVQGR